MLEIFIEYHQSAIESAQDEKSEQCPKPDGGMQCKRERDCNAVSTLCPCEESCVRMADDGAVCGWLSFMQNEASSRYIFLQFGHRDRAIIESDDVLLWPSRLC
jgi:hypothetical protein